MKKTLYFILGCILATFKVGYSQISINQGPELEVEKGAEFNRIIGSDDKAFYVYRIKTRGAGTHYFVEKYDKQSLSMIFSKDLNLEEIKDVTLDPKKAGTFTVLGAENVYIFFPIYFKADKRKVFALKTITTAGVVANGYKEIDVSPEGVAAFSVQQCPDRSKFLILNDYNVSSEPQRMRATLYDASMTKLWSKKMPTEYKESGIEISNVIVNNDGTLAYFFIYMKDFKEKTVGAAIGILNPDSDTPKAVDIELQKPKEPYTLLMKFSKTNTLACVGLFKDTPDPAKKNKRARNAGIFYYLIDLKTMAMTGNGDEYFAPDVATQLDYSGPESTSTNPGDKYYSSSQLEEVNGNYYFMTEHGYDWVSGGNTSSKVRKEVIVSKIDGASGKVKWTKILQKNSLNQSGLYNVLVHGDYLYVFCLEHPSVEKRYAAGKDYEPGKFPDVSGIAGCNVRSYEISPEGSVKKTVIYRNEDYSYQPQVQDFTLQPGNDLLIYMLKGGKEKFGTIHVK